MARAAAVLMEMNDFPSPECDEVKSTTFWAVPLSTNCRLVRMSLNSSAAADVLPGVTIRRVSLAVAHTSPKMGILVAFSISARLANLVRKIRSR